MLTSDVLPLEYRMKRYSFKKAKQDDSDKCTDMQIQRLCSDLYQKFPTQYADCGPWWKSATIGAKAKRGKKTRLR